LERLLDQLNDAVETGIDVRVPDSDRAKARPAKHRVTHGVVIGLRVFGMLASINFDNQTLLEADEIEIEAEQRRLPTEVESLGPHLPKLNPETDFLRRHRSTQLASAFR
jgi:hypothetical protein